MTGVLDPTDMSDQAKPQDDGVMDPEMSDQAKPQDDAGYEPKAIQKAAGRTNYSPAL